MGFDRSRLVQLWCPLSGRPAEGDTTGVCDLVPEAEPGTPGSGYRISGDLVLTAAHVVGGLTVHSADSAPPLGGDAAQAQATVLGATEWAPTAVVWRDDVDDVALLRLGPGLPDLPAGQPAASLGASGWLRAADVHGGRLPVGCRAPQPSA